MTVYCYPVPNKRKSVEICKAFAAGCGGVVVLDNMLRDGDAFFYGVDFQNEHIWRTVLYDKNRTFYYSDNSYFDSTRQKYFRITKNLLQHDGIGTSDCKRFRQLDIPIKDWRVSGHHIVVCEQSSSFMTMPVGYKGNWLDDLSPILRQITKRPVMIRRWQRDKAWQQAPLLADLAGAHGLIAWSSAAAVTAVLEGVPVVAMGQSACTPFSGSLADLEALPTPDHRYTWAGVLADNQFTLDEMRNGYAWEIIKNG